MNTARQIADYILALSNPEIGEVISNLKLQKLLYYGQGVHLAAFDRPLFEDEISAWVYGPVVESVYQDFKIFGKGAILLPKTKREERISAATKDFLVSIYASFGQFSAIKLSQMTHDELPWKTTPRAAVISKERMKSFFQTQSFVDEIARPSLEKRLQNATLLLQADYETDEELTAFSAIEFDDFHETD